MAAFIVEAISERNRLHITLTGFATAADIADFRLDLARAHVELGSAGASHQLLYDVSEAAIQSQETVAALRALVLEPPAASAIALVNASALAGRQLDRIFSGIDLHRCSNVAAAASWLDGQSRT